jgi:hypothetical protein
MERGFCTFTETSGTQIAVNAREVKYVRPQGPDTSLIHFDDNFLIGVRETFVETVNKLRSALV